MQSKSSSKYTNQNRSTTKLPHVVENNTTNQRTPSTHGPGLVQSSYITCCAQFGVSGGHGNTSGCTELSEPPATAQLTFLCTTYAHQFLQGKKTQNKNPT